MQCYSVACFIHIWVLCVKIFWMFWQTMYIVYKHDSCKYSLCDVLFLVVVFELWRTLFREKSLNKHLLLPEIAMNSLSRNIDYFRIRFLLRTHIVTSVSSHPSAKRDTLVTLISPGILLSFESWWSVRASGRQIYVASIKSKWPISKKTNFINSTAVNILKYFNCLIKWVLQCGWSVWASTIWNQVAQRSNQMATSRRSSVNMTDHLPVFERTLIHGHTLDPPLAILVRKQHKFNRGFNI